MPAGVAPGLAPAMPAVSVFSTFMPPPFFNSSASDSKYLTFTTSPTLSWAKFFTSGPATIRASSPFGPFMVIARDALSIAVMVALTSTDCATPTLPGELVTAAPLVCAAVGSIDTTAQTTAARRIEMCMVLPLLVE